jgi:hypothetical protein
MTGSDLAGANLKSPVASRADAGAAGGGCSVI